MNFSCIQGWGLGLAGCLAARDSTWSQPKFRKMCYFLPRQTLFSFCFSLRRSKLWLQLAMPQCCSSAAPGPRRMGSGHEFAPLAHQKLSGATLGWCWKVLGREAAQGQTHTWVPAPCAGAPRHPLLGPDRFPVAGFDCLRLPPSRSNFHPWCKQTEICRNCSFPGLSNIVLTVLLEETNEKFQSKHLGIGVGRRTRTSRIFSLSAKTIHAPFNFKKYL